MAIPDDYKDALNEWVGGGAEWYANWPIAEAHSLGEWGRLHGDSYVFERAPDAAIVADNTGAVNLDSWTYQSAKDMTVALGLDASVPGFEFLGSANAGLKADFGSSAGVYVSASGVAIKRVADVDVLRQELRERGNDGSLPQGSAMVLATLNASRAVVLTSSASHATFEAKAKANVAVTPAVPADLAGNLSVVRGASAVDMQDYGSTPVVLAMRLVVLVKRGWLWWRHLDAQGVTPISDAEQLDLLDATSLDSDYFALLDE